MIHDLERLDPLATELVRKATAAGVRLVWRAQARRTHHLLVRRGRVEETTCASSSGVGLQIVTADGRTAMGSRDDLSPTPVLAVFDRTLHAATSGEALGLATVDSPRPSADRARAVPPGIGAFDSIDLAKIGGRLADLEREISGRVPGVTLRLAWRADLDAWRVGRDDGADVVFAMPRCTLRVAASTDADGGRHSVGAAVAASDPGLADDPSVVERFLVRAIRAARLARDLPNAPPQPAGSFPLVIDYALAKGLAHEAFGHAAEADGFRSSILARDGRFRSGERVGPEHVSIVDEPIEGDHAWQPWDANGVRRERAVVVDHGMLRDALADSWSAESGGVRCTGAARAESFRSAPLPRMSNIRIEVDDPLPADGDFDDHGPEEVRDLLSAAGVLRRHPRVQFLSGYGGGQVNTATGDFVFNCKAIYELGRDGIEFRRPAIFSGSMFGALRSIREAFGPLLLDAIGTCGKWGQSVPSSGGSHWFLVLDPDPSVKLGGA